MPSTISFCISFALVSSIGMSIAAGIEHFAELASSEASSEGSVEELKVLMLNTLSKLCDAFDLFYFRVQQFAEARR